MTILALTLSVLLAIVALGAGLPKALLTGKIPAQLQSPGGLSAALVRFIGLAEVAAAGGLIAGLFWRPIGIAAAAGFAVLLIGAVIFHAKAGDYSDATTRGSAMAPIVLTVVAGLAVAALTVTA
ncbi:DoxX family protein [Actinoplanes sp. CA-252034]|uniref:DoxX family protein n=1 Tax=Actinoplanes sp. CA-252034 TaxID=3239906 RepID=UPI003D97F69C